MENIEFFSKELESALLMLDRDQAEAILMEAVGTGSPAEVTGELVTTTLNRIGEAWETGHLSLSQVYMSGVICEEMIDKILPPQDTLRMSQPTIAIGVFEDYHLLGKRIVFSTLRASGFELLDLGGGLTIDHLIETIREKNIKILLLSVLMLPSALHIKKLKEKLGQSDVKVVVGGAPFRFDETLWKEVGADACGKDSAEAIQIVTHIMEKMR